MKKIIALLILTSCISSCNHTAESGDTLDPIAAAMHKKIDTIYAQSDFKIDSTKNMFAPFFKIDSTTNLFAPFYKQGIVRGYYCYSSGDWCGSRSKMFTLYDRFDHSVYIIGIADSCLVSTRRTYDRYGRVAEGQLISDRKDSCLSSAFANRLYKSDSLLLQTLIPFVKRKWQSC